MNCDARLSLCISHDCWQASARSKQPTNEASVVRRYLQETTSTVLIRPTTPPEQPTSTELPMRQMTANLGDQRLPPPQPHRKPLSDLHSNLHSTNYSTPPNPQSAMDSLHRNHDFTSSQSRTTAVSSISEESKRRVKMHCHPELHDLRRLCAHSHHRRKQARVSGARRRLRSPVDSHRATSDEAKRCHLSERIAQMRGSRGAQVTVNVVGEESESTTLGARVCECEMSR